jgi:hypothetical protein
MDGYDHNTRWRTFKTMILAEKSSGDYSLHCNCGTDSEIDKNNYKNN